jgi:pyrroline-5-carboxylate reductase|eukprot:COSAG03_NODE_1934_length_3337_cov_5.315627_4_plen_296_part_00
MSKIGFVGTGAIAEAICTGLCTGPAAPDSVVLSPRSAERSARLAAAHDSCTVATDNQSVVDGADIIFVCVLPAQLDNVLSSLTFRPEQTIVSLVSTSTLPGVASCSKLPASQVFKMICLPPVAMHRGTCLLVPKGNATIKTMCDSLGGTVECDTEDALRALMVTTCLMGPFYNILKTQRNWLARKGVPAASASYFIGRTYLGLAQDAEQTCTDEGHYDHLVDENTPGGMNEQAIANLTRLGCYAAYDTVQDALLERLSGAGDGHREGIDVAAALSSLSTEALEQELERRKSGEKL